MPPKRLTSVSAGGDETIPADRSAHWRADTQRELFFNTPPAPPTARAPPTADSPAEEARLQVSLDRCNILFASGSEAFAGAADAGDKYLRASRALGIKPNRRVEAQFRAGPPAGPERIAVTSEELDEGTLCALLGALSAVPSVTHLKLYHNSLSPVGWALLARLLPASSVASLECAGQADLSALNAAAALATSSQDELLAAGVSRKIPEVSRLSSVSSPLEAHTEAYTGVEGVEEAAVDSDLSEGNFSSGESVLRADALAASGVEAEGVLKADVGLVLKSGSVDIHGTAVEVAPFLDFSFPPLELPTGSWLRSCYRLSALLACAPGLTLLSARHSGLTGALDALSICSSLANPTCSLVALDLSGNPLADIGVIALSRALSANHSLEALALGSVRAGDVGASALAHALTGRRRASIREIDEFNLAVSAERAPPASVESESAPNANLAKSQSVKRGGTPGLLLSRVKGEGGKGERAPLLSTALPSPSIPYAGPTLVILDSTKDGQSTQKYWALGNKTLKWLSLADNHISYAGKQELYEACVSNEILKVVELAGNPCSRGLGASLAYADVQLLSAAWRAVLARRSGAQPPVPADIQKGGKPATSVPTSSQTEPKANSGLPPTTEPAVSAFSVGLLLRLFVARPQLLDNCPSFKDASDLSAAPGLLALAGNIDALVGALIAALPGQTAEAEAAVLAAANKLGAFGVAVSDEAELLAAGAALEGSWADELEMIGAAGRSQLPGAEPHGVAAAGVAPRATAQSRLTGAVQTLWADVSAIGRSLAPRAQPA
mmetsp:Transcript_41800/g.103133  ORF Transcript_41800/g.103133 Transcript_41800/m.103133 type:complete len:784 (-) Transcript_41800:25-2376(-)